MCTYKPRLFTSFARALIIVGVFLAAGCDKEAETESTELPTKTTLAREDFNAFTEKFADPELEAFKGDLDAMKERGLIRALVTPSPTEFFIDDGKIRGIQAEYLQQFAKFINRGIKNEADKIRIKYVPVPFPELIPALLEGRGDIIATFLTVTDKRGELVSFTEPFRSSVNEIIVTNKDEPELTAVEDIAGKDVYVLANSSYVEHLLKLNTRLKQQGLDPVNIKQAD
ncbi:MAG: transporter substrate-binding domain-containing protein, partial [Gammaproteobacteria bacterium]